MSVVSWIRQFAAQAASDHADRPKTKVPQWLLVPGLTMLGFSLFAYMQFLRAYPQWGIDIRMYRGALEAFVNGEAVYQQGYTTAGLPYTYPPVTLPVLLPLIWTNLKHAHYGMTAVGIVAMVLVLWFTTRTLGYRGVAGRVGLVGAAAAILLWTEPFQWNFDLGQVNILIMLPVVIDLSLRDRSKFKGIGIGIATASKLLPGLFIVYLLITRRVRAAIVASATFGVLTATGWIIQPGGSYDYWIRGLAFDSHRVLMTLGPRYVGNQSLQGFVARVFGTEQQNSVAWIVSVVLAATSGLALAAWAQRRGEEAMAMVIVGFTALLISPVSWSHYWLWIAPMALVLGDVVRRTTGRMQHVAALLACAALVPFLMFPLRSGPGQPLIPRGLLWVADGYEGLLKAAMMDPYVPTTIALFVITACWLRARRPTSLGTPLDAAIAK